MYLQLQQTMDSGLHQQQKLLMTVAMQHAIHVMQLPIVELAEWLQTEVEKNPALEIQLPEYEAPRISSTAKRLPLWEMLEPVAVAPISLFDHLMAQARDQFTSPDDVERAQ